MVNQTKWQKMYKDRYKELEGKKSTRTYVPKNKLTNRKKVYNIHDNGGRPFQVVIDINGIFVYEIDQEATSDRDDYVYDELVYKTNNFLGYWSGYDSSPYKMNGNSILIKIKKYEYVCIGMIIFKFNTDEEILDYVSPVGNSDVPYPVAFSENNVYFMLDYKFVSKDDLDTPATVQDAENLYGEFYEIKKNSPVIHKMKNVRILVDRVW